MTDQWRPIESAPHDVAILAFDPSCYMECVVVEWEKGRWMDATDNWRLPTHWMPLPSYPEGSHD
jgi:hypothetical protein